ncbi:MAG: DUF1080 domain-containing protein [Planctomycetes bacterium]|nr:DUF1080 domain-containing protein [Planctomycetota bacterium]MCH9727149.1 DUF1080 domain-containing protein [Planctomycetota bacterium]MCH9778542.1 DUF1080 domain-containing protein [Planctomycetota bacterium]MDF1742679.1 DUF1080 domain-containing protein [Gimesia sp.]
MKIFRTHEYLNAFTGIMAAILISSFLGSSAYSGEKNSESEAGWVDLFNGKDLTGWRIAEGGPWEVKDGTIVVTGKRSHLFTEKEYKNFEFKADVMTTPGSNSGIFFHSKFQEEGWPTQGYESQVNVTHKDPVKTGSIYNRVKLFKTPAKDNEWWTQHIIVKGRNVVIKINGETVIDYTEPEGATGSPSLGEKGSFALQAHDPKSVVYYKNIRVKPLAD